MKGSKGILWKTAMMLAILAMAAGVITGTGCLPSDDDHGGDDSIFSSRAYKGHASDRDINLFCANYPKVIGTRLDDCQTCHTGGDVTVTKGGSASTTFKNACDFCHYIPFPPPTHDISGETVTGIPTTYYQTLNAYGKAYMDNGRGLKALWKIADEDSDGDGHENNVEIRDIRYPGDASSYPGLAQCGAITVSLNEIKSMTLHTQFGLNNTSKQQYDFYATFTGVKVKDLLAAKGIDMTGATGVDFLAPDGFKKSFTMAQINDQFPYHQFFPGFGTADLATNCAFVEYPANTYGLGYGDTIMDPQWHLLAFKREGILLEPAYLDPVSGKINGEGPFRNIIPPGKADYLLNQPDRGQNADLTGCTMPEWNYASAKDHNAGNEVKAVVIVRIQPMPACEEFDIKNGGWALVDANQILIYGHNVAP